MLQEIGQECTEKYLEMRESVRQCLRVYIYVQMLFYSEEILMTIAIAVNIICVQPKMENIPDGDWYCYECVSKVSNSSSSACIHIGLMTTM